MSFKFAPPPTIAGETLLALLTATMEFAAAKPWEYMCDSDVVGLVDPKTGDSRLVTVLGNAKEVFGAVFYRNASGLRWLLNTLNSDAEVPSLENFDTMDSVKVELAHKSELSKADLGLLKAVNFKPVGKGLIWPQFQSVQPGWLPWFINQAEAEQLLVDLPRLTSFASLFRNHANLFDNRSPTEIPFLPSPMPSRPLVIEDLEWKPTVVSPETFDPFKATDEQLGQLRKLKHDPKAGYEYGSRLLMGSRVLEEGRPCYSRINLLVEHGDGLILGFDLVLATVPFAQSAGMGLVKTLVKSGSLPGAVLVDDTRLEPVLRPLCNVLNIDVLLSEELEGLAEAKASLDNFMARGMA